MSPFKSPAQRKFLFANKPNIAKKFAVEGKTMSGKKSKKKRTKKGSY